MIAAFLAADIAFLAGYDVYVAAVVGVVAFIALLLVAGASAYRGYTNETRTWVARFPTQTDQPDGE